MHLAQASTKSGVDIKVDEKKIEVQSDATRKSKTLRKIDDNLNKIEVD